MKNRTSPPTASPRPDVGPALEVEHGRIEAMLHHCAQDGRRKLMGSHAAPLGLGAQLIDLVRADRDRDAAGKGAFDVCYALTAARKLTSPEV
jgi:hypothetical protein